MDLTDDQKKAFEVARKKATELMHSLYGVRLAFYRGNRIPENGKGVWKHIPRAQSMVHEIEAEIEKAEKSARALEAS